MAIIQSAIERKLSSLLGAKVSFEHFSVSPLKGQVEAAGMRVENDGATLLAIALVRAQISIKHAIKGEIVVKSITVEKPVVNLVDGKLPQRPPTSPPGDGEDDKSAGWKLDVEKLFIIDGQVSLQLGSFELTTGRVLAELNRAGRDYSLTFLAEDVRRGDRGAMIGQVGATGKITDAMDLTAIADAGLNVEVTLGNTARMTFSTPRIRTLLALL